MEEADRTMCEKCMAVNYANAELPTMRRTTAAERADA
jgi:hypothetical protein